jgi:hypothetical protein
MPSGAWPTNPFTGVLNEAPTWPGPAASQGMTGVVNNAVTPTAGYTISGFGKTALLTLTLSNG